MDFVCGIAEIFGYAVSRFQKSKILKQKFDIEVTAEMEELRTMCNLSEGIYERGMAHITDEEYRFLMKRRAIPTSARDMLDIMLNAVYTKLVSPKAVESGTIERISDKDQEDPFYSKANMELLEESRRQMESGQIVTKSWEELERLANG